MTKPIIPVAGGGRTPEPPAYGGPGREIWARGRTFLEFVEEAGPYALELEAAFQALCLPEELGRFFAAYPRRVRILTLADHATRDARVNVAQAERLCTLGTQIWMRIFAPEPELLQRLTLERCELPVLVLLADDQREFGRWGPRPQRLAALLAEAPAARADEIAATFYAESRGVHLAEELHALLAAHAEGR